MPALTTFGFGSTVNFVGKCENLVKEVLNFLDYGGLYAILRGNLSK